MQRSGSVTIGPYLVLQQLAAKSGLIAMLYRVFGGDAVMLILDIALYGIDTQRTQYQFFEIYAMDHAVFSEHIPSDEFIAHALRREVREPEINLFRHLWARHALEGAKDQDLYCGTVWTQPEEALGVVLEQRKPAIDGSDPIQTGVNLLVRQKDGLPLAYTVFPGSDPDLAEKSERIEFLQMLLNNRFPHTAAGCAEAYTEAEIDGFCKRIHFARNCRPAYSGNAGTGKPSASSRSWVAIQSRLLPLEPFLTEKCFESPVGAAAEAKALIWFVSAILQTLLWQALQEVGAIRKDGRAPDVWQTGVRLASIKAIIDTRTGRYCLPQRLPAFERDLFRCIGISEEEVSEYVESLETEIEMEMDDEMEEL